MHSVDQRGASGDDGARSGPASEPSRAERSDAGSSRTIPYQPALDGVRALAVLAVLLFHGEVAGFGGGYLGVSVFFTLSGFLITSLLAAETEGRGRVELGRFYARRARRLLPASVLLVALVVLASVVTDWFDAVSDLRAHVVGSLLQVANWVFLANDGSYQELLQQAAGAASPLEHYWSLAIEEQFYWLWPIAFVALWRVGRTARGRLIVLGGVTAVFFVAAPVTAAVWGSDAAYWASPARAGEILAGAFLAVAIAGRRLHPRVALLAPLALIVLAVCVVTFPTVGGPAYSGWLPMIGVVSALLLLGLQVDSPTQRLCSLPPLVWLGTISYGVYLFHWPIFVVMNEERMNVDGVPLLALRLATTLIVAQLSYVLYEQPIRRATWLSVRPTMIGAGVATAAVVAVAFVAIPSSSSSYWEADGDAAEAAALGTGDEPLVALVDESSADDTTDDSSVDDDALGAGDGGADPSGADDADADGAAEPSGGATTGDEPTSDASATDVGGSEASGSSGVVSSEDADVASGDEQADDGSDDGIDGSDGGAPAVDPTDESATGATDEPPPTTLAPIPELSRPVRIIVAGDSTAEAFGAGVVNWAAFTPELAQAELNIEKGCGFVRGGEYRLDDEWFAVRDGCADWLADRLPDRIADADPDVVMMLTTSFDVLDRRFDGEGDGAAPADMRDRILADFAAVTDEALANGAGTVAWVKGPIPDPFWLSLGTDQEQPDRHAVLHSVMDEIAAERPAVHVVDLGAYFTEAGLDDDVDVRPDGLHADGVAATEIAADFLGGQLVRAALDLL